MNARVRAMLCAGGVLVCAGCRAPVRPPPGAAAVTPTQARSLRTVAATPSRPASVASRSLPSPEIEAMQGPPVDRLVAARAHAAGGELLAALALLDEMPTTHTEYAAGRTLAAAVEQRIRTSQEKILEGLVLRGQWRDEEAIARFQAALDLWPQSSAARGLLAAARRRLASTCTTRGAPRATLLGGAADVVGEVMTRPIELGDEDGRSIPAAPAGETAAGGVSPPAPAAPNVARMRRLKLIGQASQLLVTGELDRALHILEGLRREAPGDPNVLRQLVRVHHQRALLAYGRGRLDVAIAAWRVVIQLDADHAAAQEYLRAATYEQNRR